MGNQKSYVYTNACNAEENSKDIERILDLFRKYNVRCAGDNFATCTHKLRFNEELIDNGILFDDDQMYFPKGMEMLVIYGMRTAQRSIERLFDGSWYANENEDKSAWSKMTEEEKEFASNIVINYAENLQFVGQAETDGKITVEKLDLKPHTFRKPLDEQIMAAENKALQQPENSSGDKTRSRAPQEERN